MKKVLLASSALVLSAGIAAAEVSVGGDGRMGVIDDFGDTDLTFTSRIRISFSASGETDGGMAFGGSIRADNAGNGASGTAGSVFIEGGFGKLSMGDVDGAALAAVGDVSGVGLTGLGDLNEMQYLSRLFGADPTALYEYSTGDLTFYASAEKPEVPSDIETYGLGVSYGLGNYTVALAYEMTDTPAGDVDHIVVGATAGFGDATVKAIYGEADGDLVDSESQWGLSLDYVFGATTVTAFYTDQEDLLGAEAYGVGASYDLGGGASLKGGYVQNETSDEDAFDFGISMSF